MFALILSKFILRIYSRERHIFYFKICKNFGIGFLTPGSNVLIYFLLFLKILAWYSV